MLFGMGVVSGVVMSYQFGTNWSVLSNNSRFDLVYYNWRLVVMAVVVTSLAFDIREVILRMN